MWNWLLDHWETKSHQCCVPIWNYNGSKRIAGTERYNMTGLCNSQIDLRPIECFTIFQQFCETLTVQSSIFKKNQSTEHCISIICPKLQSLGAEIAVKPEQIPDKNQTCPCYTIESSCEYSWVVKVKGILLFAHQITIHCICNNSICGITTDKNFNIFPALRKVYLKHTIEVKGDLRATLNVYVNKCRTPPWILQTNVFVN